MGWHLTNKNQIETCMDGDKKETDDGIEPIDVNPRDIRSLDNRLSNLERVMDTVDGIGEKFEKGLAYFVEKKNENDEKQRQHEEKQAEENRKYEEKARTKALIFALIVFITFMAFGFTAFLMGEKEIAMGILSILLALGAGGSVASYFVKR